MKIYIISFLASLLPLLVIDAVWLTTMAKRFYNHHLGHILAESPKLLPAGFFYLIYSLGITYFVVMPAIQGSFGYGKTFLIGALLGFIAYATYDLTNHATVKDWPTIVTCLDLVWGSLLTGTVSIIAVYITKSLS